MKPSAAFSLLFLFLITEDFLLHLTAAVHSRALIFIFVMYAVLLTESTVFITDMTEKM